MTSERLETPARGRSLVRAGALTVSVTVAALSFNLVTGILIARALGPAGRGAVTAALAAPPILSWLFEMGVGGAAVYHQARHPEQAAKLIGTWLAMLSPLAVVGVGVGELLLPHLLAAQSDHTLLLARILMLNVALVFLGDLMYGVVLGDHDFVFFNAMRLLQPLLVMTTYLVLWATAALNVTTAVAANAGTAALVIAIVTTRVLRRHGLGRPSVALGRTTFWYGLRAHSAQTASLVNTRLDVLIIPAFVAASGVGFYSVASSIASVVMNVSGSIGTIVFPAAAARGLAGRGAVVKSLYATLAIAGLLALSLGVFARVGVHLVYGSSFDGSVLPLRILLVGAVLYAGAGTVCSGLYALNRPFTAGMAQMGAAAVTVAGLLVFLRVGGIEAAAIVSTIAYGLVFVTALLLYRRAAGLGWHDIVLSPARMRLMVRQAARGAVGRA
jgi:O-antigen/teichoic acid export membrane protein